MVKRHHSHRELPTGTINQRQRIRLGATNDICITIPSCIAVVKNNSENRRLFARFCDRENLIIDEIELPEKSGRFCRTDGTETDGKGNNRYAEIHIRVSGNGHNLAKLFCQTFILRAENAVDIRVTQISVGAGVWTQAQKKQRAVDITIGNRTVVDNYPVEPRKDRDKRAVPTVDRAKQVATMISENERAIGDMLHRQPPLTGLVNDFRDKIQPAEYNPPIRLQGVVMGCQYGERTEKQTGRQLTFAISQPVRTIPVIRDIRHFDNISIITEY